MKLKSERREMGKRGTTTMEEGGRDEKYRERGVEGDRNE